MSDRPAELRFLITGTARSGTTLVQRLCCELPGVWIPAETHFWSMAEELAGSFEWPLRGEDRHTAIEHVLRGLSGGELPATAAAVTREMTGRKGRIGLWTVFESLVAAMSPPDRSVLGEKTPNHMFWWEHLLTAVPTLQLLVVVRDPRAVLRSQRAVGWGEHDVHPLAERWIAHQRAALDALRLFGPERVMILRYEDVAAQPDASRSRIAGFLDVADAATELPEDLLAEYPLFPAREAWKSRALGAISPEPSGGLADIEAGDVAAIEACCGRLMGELGYETGSGAGSPPPTGESLDRVLSFRRWNAGVAASTGLPIY